MKNILLYFLPQLLMAFSLVASSKKRDGIFLKNYPVDTSILYHPDTSYRAIKSIGTTYGYEILINRRAIIRQLNIPGEAGKKGFITKKQAERVAQFVLSKMRLGIMPPSVNKIDLDKLKINY